MIINTIRRLDERSKDKSEHKLAILALTSRRFPWLFFHEATPGLPVRQRIVFPGAIKIAWVTSEAALTNDREDTAA